MFSPLRSPLGYIQSTDGSYVPSNIQIGRIPAEQGIDVPFLIYKDPRTGVWTTNLNIEDYKITPTTTYYVTNTGSSGNNGLTIGSPKGSIDQAIEAGNATGNPYQINVTAGEYHKDRGWNTTPTQNCNIIADGDGAFIRSIVAGGLTFALSSGNMYVDTNDGTGAVVQNIYDHKYINGEGNALRLREVNSSTECAATAGSWYTDGTAVYVHASDGRNLATDGADIQGYLNINPPKVSRNIHVYVENIHIEGFQTCCFEVSSNAGTDDIRIYLNNVSLKYNADGNGMSCNGAAYMICKDVVTADNWSDGLNWHEKDGIIPLVFEVDSIHHNNGQSGATNTNATTMHDDGDIVRVNVVGGGSARVFHDIDNGKSINYGCTALRSRGLTETSSFGYGLGVGTDATQGWFIDCYVAPHAFIRDLDVGTGSTAYVSGSNLSRSNKTTGTVLGI